MDSDSVMALTRRILKPAAQDDPVPKAVLSTDAAGVPAWRTGQPMQVWTLDTDAVPGWRALPLLGSVAYREPVQELPAPTTPVVITVGTLLSLTAGVTNLQDQVTALRNRLNDEIRATEALAAELRRVNLMRAAP